MANSWEKECRDKAEEDQTQSLGLFSVKKEEEELVKPARDTPNEVLYLSNLDDQPAQLVTCQTIHVYAGKEEVRKDPAKVIKKALSKALVFYYPLAGRLAESEQEPGKLQVVCEEQGAVFVQATADCTLRQVDYFTHITPFLSQLLHWHPSSFAHHHIPPLVVQLTRFQCGGFVLGMALSHVMVDGIGCLQFLNAMAEMARDEKTQMPSVKPVWMRQLLKPRNPPCVQFSHPEFPLFRDRAASQEWPAQLSSLERRAFVFSGEFIRQLKLMVTATNHRNGDKEISRCSAFESLAAFLWKTRVESLVDGKFITDESEEAPLRFAVNIRNVGPIPSKGYYGNAFHGALATASVKEIKEWPISRLVGLIQSAKAQLTREYLMSVVDFLQVNRERLMPPLASHLYVTDWTRLDYWRVDFGWGEAVHVSPVDIPYMHVAAFLPCPRLPDEEEQNQDKERRRLIMCLPPKVMSCFASRVAQLQRQLVGS